MYKVKQIASVLMAMGSTSITAGVDMVPKTSEFRDETAHCVLDMQYQSHPYLKPSNNSAAQLELDNLAADFSSDSPLMKIKTAATNHAAGQGQIIIPVVFHVMQAATPGVEDISFEQMEEALVQVNEDFNLQNARRAGNIYDDFLPVEADVGVRFELAQRDPDGYPTNGVTRTGSVFTFDGGQIEIKETIQWPRDRYLNIWVVRSSDGSNGSAFAFLPSSVADRPVYDGIITSHWAVGRTGTAASSHAGNLTHEIGHWANLHHIWGSSTANGAASGCDFDDGVADTPNSIGHADNLLCGTLVESCGTPDNVANFMDYACEVMYTNDQRSRMLAALSAPISGRNNLWTEENKISTGVEPSPVYALFKADTPWVPAGGEVNFTDESVHTQGSAITSWQWSFPGGVPNTFSGQAPPAITYNSEGTYEVSLTVSNNNDSNTRTRLTQVDVHNNIIMNKSGTQSVSIDQQSWFYDSGFVGNHDNDETGVLTMTAATPGFVVEVDFYEYNLEPQEADGTCLWDFLEVFDGNSTSDPLIGKFCGKFPQPTIRASNKSGALTFRFTSDDNTFINGWRAQVNEFDPQSSSDVIVMGSTAATDQACGAEFFDSGKNLPYFNDENSVLTIQPPADTADVVTVSFTEFQVENDGCQWDYLEIFNGDSTSAPQIGGKYCGETLPPVVSGDNPSGALTFKFTSDNNTTLNGWKADVTCGPLNDLIFANSFDMSK